MVLKEEIFFAWLPTAIFYVASKNPPLTFGRFWPVPLIFFGGWQFGKAYRNLSESGWALKPQLLPPEERAKRPFPPLVSLDLDWPPLKVEANTEEEAIAQIKRISEDDDDYEW